MNLHRTQNNKISTAGMANRDVAREEKAPVFVAGPLSQ